MNDTPEAPPARPTWKLWHLPLMLLPSVLYLVLYPVIYRNAVEDALHTFILEHRPYLKWGNTRMMCALGATLKCAFLMLLVLLPVSFLWARSKYGKSITDGGRLLGGCLLVIIVNGAICYGGCSLGDYSTRDLRTLPEHLLPSEATTAEVWRASTANGEKPGIGMELRREEGKIVCAVYLLDPGHPHDFEQGRERPVTLTKTAPDELVFTVRWSDSESENLTLRLPDGIPAAQFRGELSDSIAGRKATLYEFRRVVNDGR